MLENVPYIVFPNYEVKAQNAFVEFLFEKYVKCITLSVDELDMYSNL